MSTTPHDALFKAVFIDPENAAGALRTMVPPAISQALDWSSLAYTDGAFVDDAMRYGFTDLLFTARWRSGKDAHLYFIFEHQSSVDDSMAFRLLRYLVRIWERWRRERRTATELNALPLIVPVVLYHGDSAWSAPTSLRALVHLPDADRNTLTTHAAELTYVVGDLSETPDIELRERAMPALSTVAMLCLKHARSHADIFERLHRWRDLLKLITVAPTGLEAIAHVMGYILQVHDVDTRTLYEFAGRELGPETKEIAMTTADRLREEGKTLGLEQGLHQGRQEGLHQGRQEGLRAALSVVLQRRFGEQLDDIARQRLEQATAAQLEDWLERSAVAATLADALNE